MDPNQEKVLGLLGKMKLSDSEMRSVKVGGAMAARTLRCDQQVVAKILAEKPVRSENLEAALGRVWCPIKGIECKELGDNRFLITLLQPAGKRKALDDGPWMFGRDLVVVVEFDGSKTIDEMEFSSIPIWVRVARIPLGLMTKATGEAVGDMVGSVLEVDADEKGLAIGEVLRVKVRLNIEKPLMRGVTLDAGDGGSVKVIWCPLSYEFLPDFCYVCGFIGHIDKTCEKKLGKGEEPQFSKALRFIPEKKKSWGLALLPSWRAADGRSSGSAGSWGSGGKSRSDVGSWRKEEGLKRAAGVKPNTSDEAMSPSKEKEKSALAPVKAKALSFPAEPLGQDGSGFAAGLKDPVGGKGEEGGVPIAAAEGGGGANSAMQDVGSAVGSGLAEGALGVNAARRTFKRQPRKDGRVKEGAQNVSEEGKKRSRGTGVEDMEVDVSKKVKRVASVEVPTNQSAGPMDRSCESQ